MRRLLVVFIPLFAAMLAGCGDEPSGSGSSLDASGGDSVASVQDLSTTVPDVDGPTDNGGPPTQPDLAEVEEADDGGFGDAPSDLEVADTVVDADALPDAVPAGSDADAGVCGVVVEVDVSSNEELNKPWADLLLEGQGFEAFAGREIHLNVLSGGTGPTGQATAIIACGAFAFFAPEVLENGGAIYKMIVLFIDEDGDGVCEVGVDSVWTYTTGASSGDKEILMTPTDFLWTEFPLCPPSF